MPLRKYLHHIPVPEGWKPWPNQVLRPVEVARDEAEACVMESMLDDNNELRNIHRGGILDAGSFDQKWWVGVSHVKSVMDEVERTAAEVARRDGFKGFTLVE